MRIIKDKSNNTRALIWDYDGTLFDTRQKNFNVTKRIVRRVKGNSDPFSALNSVTEYYNSHLRAVNWRNFYRDEFQLSEEEIDEAGKLWTEFQLKETTPVLPIDGVCEVIKSLKFPQGIVSQNSKENILQNLRQNNLDPHFQSIIGYEEVDLKKQKPHPDGLIKCISDLCQSKSGYVFYIGDHETDMLLVKNANEFLIGHNKDLKVISIAAAYSDCFYLSGLKNDFDFTANSAGDIVKIINDFSE
jgi:phosphoglycolate phosphatase-like HAD superfamily hydrolase